MNINYCLFLTATISPPNNIPSLKRTDSALRENDYAEAIKIWVKYNLPIVFCENSETKSNLIHDILSKSGIAFEYLSFKSIQSHLGKGHGEFEIFDYAFKNSTLLRNSKNVIKVTGRYNVRNFQILFEDFQKRQSYIFVNISQNLTWADSRFFCFANAFWDCELSKFSNSINEANHINFEHLLAKSTMLAIINDHKWSATNNIPWLSGIYGTDNVKYKKNIIKYSIKNILFKIKSYLIQFLDF